MEIIYHRGTATAAQIHRDMEDAPTYTTVRGLLRVLLAKSHVEIERDGARYVYRPTVAKSSAAASMLSHVVHTFFGGSPSKAMTALLGSQEIHLGEEDIERLQLLLAAHEERMKNP